MIHRRFRSVICFDVCMLIVVLLLSCHSWETVQRFVVESPYQGGDIFVCTRYTSLEGLKENLTVLDTAESYMRLDQGQIRCQDSFPCYLRILFGILGILWNTAFPSLVC